MDEDRLKDEIRDAKRGISSKRAQKRLRRFNRKEGLLSDDGSRTDRIPGQGMARHEDESLVILDCGHPYDNGFGHEADCGHTVCRECLERYDLVCAEPRCFRRFCNSRRCRNKPHMYAGLPFCLKHKISFMHMYMSTGVLSRSKANQLLEGYKRDYEAKKFKPKPYQKKQDSKDDYGKKDIS